MTAEHYLLLALRLAPRTQPRYLRLALAELRLREAPLVERARIARVLDTLQELA